MLDTGHKIMFEETKVLTRTSHYHARLGSESIKIHKHKYNFSKKEESLKLKQNMVSCTQE